MNKFCSECGFRLEGEFKFCPNCGAEIKAGKNINEPEQHLQTEFIVCEICGEENSPTNITCSGCGAKLKGRTEVKNVPAKKQAKPKTEKKKEVVKNVKDKPGNQSVQKQLEVKKVALIFAAVIVLIFAVLYISGVFDSGLPQIENQKDNVNQNSGADLTNINAINDLEQKVKANPTDKQSTIQLANLLQDSKFFDRAVIYYKKYLEMEPEDVNARVDLGICYYNLRDYQNATKEMETAVKHQPDHQVANLNLGIVNLASGNLEAAKKWFGKTVDIDPNTDAGKKAQELLQSHIQQ